MKKFQIPCQFADGQTSNFSIYIGDPKPENHPLQFQASWLSKERGGTIPEHIMDAIKKLQNLAYKNDVSVAELCAFAINAANSDDNSKIAIEGDVHQSQKNREKG